MEIDRIGKEIFTNFAVPYGFKSLLWFLKNVKNNNNKGLF